ncbi:HsmA family protein [Mobilicoccus massiliensis]|uniref:HsmA family protein n=1 Tax=Mobilicoccus massiliensis TaxID=1522310 RepID=UPI00058D7DB2|nr:HsmA family protein [Mobilicoccus massiliensis]
MLPSAIVLITAALFFYTLGVWAERRAGVLRAWHAVAFVLGFAADAAGTFVMSRIAAAGGAPTEGLAATLGTLMAVTGAIALVLMGVHALWAIVVLLRDRANEKENFHRFSVGVWALWLVPYFAGMASSMAA